MLKTAFTDGSPDSQPVANLDFTQALILRCPGKRSGMRLAFRYCTILLGDRLFLLLELVCPAASSFPLRLKAHTALRRWV